MTVKTTMMLGGALVLLASAADAHVSIASGNGVANTTQLVTFGVGHGCSGADTYRVVVDIPAGVTSVRTLTSDFGRATAQTNAAGLVTSVTWQKPDADLLPGDTGYYELRVRMRLPDAPFTTVYFPAHQTCRTAAGVMTTVDWIGTPGMTAPDGGMLEAAPALNLVPARRPGWNQFTVPQRIADPSVFFGDALIVWRGTAAYSANPTTTQLIMMTPGVTALTGGIQPNEQIWVRY